MVLKHGQKYNSFYDKIKDYQKRKLLLEEKAEKKKVAGEYSKEYYALIKAKKDIRDRIEESLDGVLDFSAIVRMGRIKKNNRPQMYEFKRLGTDKELESYDFADESDIKKEIEDDMREFIRSIFNEERIERLLVELFPGEKIEKLEQEDIDYRRNIASIMTILSVSELQKHIDPKYSQFLSQDLNRIILLCDAIRGHGKKKPVSPMPSAHFKPVRLPD